MPGSGRRVAPPSAFGKNGGGGSSAGRGCELPVRRRGRGRPPRAVASRRHRRPAGLLPAAQSASSEASAGGGAGAAAARVLAACLAEGRAPPVVGGRELFPRAPARSLRASLHPGGARVRPRGQDKERCGDPAGWPLPPLAAEPVPERAGARAPSRGAAMPRGGFRPEPASRAKLPIGLPIPQAGSGCLRGGWTEVVPRAGHVPSAVSGGRCGPRGSHAWARSLSVWLGVPRSPGRLETNRCR